jgi:MbtH protein
MADERTDDRGYRVVLNDEEQYSIWWADRDLPAGWHPDGTEGTREACLAHIGEVWTDMRPLSLRRSMERSAAAAGQPGG